MIQNLIKLVIWDMDETFWKGTISEEDVVIIEENIQIVKELTDRGIMNSICSKNEYEVVVEKLKEIGVFEYFVFPVINWNAKGHQIKELIARCQLREENVLFIDDNVYNLQEAKYFCPKLNLAEPEFLENILDNKYLSGKNDIEHKRLKEYKLLEQKYKEKISYQSNEEFLYASNIQVSIHDDCLNEVERIEELIHRTNQLNFTKNRMNRDELLEILKDDSVATSYIKVQDNFGEYGIVGFYALRSNCLEHFLFSCRVLGMGVEQWVYSKLNYPKIQIKEPVSCELLKQCPNWINSDKKVTKVKTVKDEKKEKKILIRGGCDLQQMEYYLKYGKDAVKCEFNHLNYHREHTVLTKGILTYEDDIKKKLIQKVAFLYTDCFKSEIFSGKYDVVVYSVLMDYVQKVYELKNYPDVKVAYGGFDVNISNDEIDTWDEEEREFYKNNLVDVGGISNSEFRANLQFIRDNIGANTKLIIINGCEVALDNDAEKNYHLRHIEMNKVVDDFVKENSNTYLLDIRKYVKSKEQLTNNIRHYQRNVYYHMAKELIELIGNEEKIEMKSWIGRKKDTLLKILKRV